MDRISTDEQRRLIDDLGKLIAERAQSETSIQTSYQARQAATESQGSAERERLNASIHQEKATTQSQQNSALAAIARGYETGIEAATRKHDQQFRDANRFGLLPQQQ